MAFKYVALFALLAAASAAPQHYYEQQAHLQSYQPHIVKQVVQPVIKKIVEHEEPANYDFEYAVKDEHTGDIKEQHESAKDGAISGFYTLIDADGFRRIVHYTADDHQGFVADVKREQVEGYKAPVAVKKVVAAPVVHKYVAAPVVHKYVAPVVEKYEAPVQHHEYYQHQAPVEIKKFVAPVVAKVVEAPAKYHSYENNHDFSSHVSFKGPSSNYSY
jgi:Insect cuticle protein